LANTDRRERCGRGGAVTVRHLARGTAQESHDGAVAQIEIGGSDEIDDSRQRHHTCETNSFPPYLPAGVEGGTARGPQCQLSAGRVANCDNACRVRALNKAKMIDRSPNIFERRRPSAATTGRAGSPVFDVPHREVARHECIRERPNGAARESRAPESAVNQHNNG
jgi:hypothetical protein